LSSLRPKGAAALIYSDDVLGYDFGPQHPLQPVRYKLTHDLMAGYGLFDAGVLLVPPPTASDAELEVVHDPGYIHTVRALGDTVGGSSPRAGLGPGDNPVFHRMHEVSALVAGGSIEAARIVMAGRVNFAFNIAGGLHHALPARASGFCIYNDPAVAIAWLLRNGAERVVYLDTDAHHGDGVQWIFYEDPRVMTISVHESGRFLFPGTGDIGETGHGRGRGTSINIPLDPGASNADLLLALDEVALPLARAFNPDILVLQHGADIHHLDPLTHLDCTLDVFAQIAKRECALALDICQGRAISGGGGGYAYVEVVPRAWTSMFAAMAGIDLPEELPETWRLDAGISATGLAEDSEAPEEALASTERSIGRLLKDLGRLPV
jgi:acetoin utilization protein AcuC